MRLALPKPRFIASDQAGLCSAVLVIAIGCVMAYWGVQLAYPSRPVAASPARPLADQANALLEAAEPFDPQTASGGDPDAIAALDVRLLGTVSFGERGRAVLLSEGKQITLGMGDELVPGVVLSQVGPKFIVFSAGGATQRVELAEPTPSDEVSKSEEKAK